VISTNAGGLPEININGYCGYMSNVGDVEDMARNAISILKDHATYEHFRTGALRQAGKFDIKNIVPQYEDLYARCIAKSKKSLVTHQS